VWEELERWQAAAALVRFAGGAGSQGSIAAVTLEGETCAWCDGPMPSDLRAEARFCSKRCRQASSRHALRLRLSSQTTSG
jgi:hypothetical protein